MKGMKGNKVFLVDPEDGRDLIFCPCYNLEVHHRDGKVLPRFTTEE